MTAISCDIDASQQNVLHELSELLIYEKIMTKQIRFKETEQENIIIY